MLNLICYVSLTAQCDPGSGGPDCKPCDKGTYKPKPGTDPCIPCDAGYTTDGAGKTGKSDCM